MKKRSLTQKINEASDAKRFWEDHSHDMQDAGPEYSAKVVERNANLKAAKEGRINMRVNAKDLMMFKQVADRKGVPYQTLLNQIIHQYSIGTLVDVDEVRKMFPVIKKRVG